MKKLTIDDIQFIDTYLSNSDIHYEDIRVEMIDHVASEIESRINQGDEHSFYDVFKDYMVENKTLIVKQGSKPLNWKILKGVSKQFLKNLYSWQVIIGTIASFLVFIFFDNFIWKIQDVALIIFPVVLLLIIVSIAFIINGKKKFSFVGNFGILLYLFFNVNNQFIPYLEHQSLGFYINFGITAVVFANSFKTMLELSLYYKKCFQLA
ncbi:hypothetical protein [Aquimarina sp. 2201CG14-23]|uniref:hypothetical protein n=1 Tax=Aquimarina mycalae TaxID=3040073 RepID=UPI002477D737|nr:hypothetical protein [Aquimarina sp. 2201CG14-23]MDH7446394.1 hypothetical protein [Aquimarina sp. 2201CG14-23]